MKPKLKDEFEYLRETYSDEWSDEDIVHEIINRCDEGLYDDDRKMKREVREHAIEIGEYVEVTQEQLNRVHTSCGKKKCDFRMNKKMYVFKSDIAVSKDCIHIG